VSAGLKWPNDVLVDGAKLAGILAEADLSGPDPVVVVGMGMNVGWAPEGAARLGDGIDPLAVLRELLVALDELPEDLMSEYRSRLATLGRTVRVELPGGESCEGRAMDVESDGRLVVLDECGLTHRFDVGDVIHVR
jgi:BirA family biotin operon repressor/biotin-[acetyl-CoA-carboxylase] ligase